MPGGISLAVLDPGEDLFLGLFAEALELGDLSFVTRLGQRLDRIGVQLFVQGLDLFPAQTGDVEQVEQPGWHRSEKLVVKFEFTGSKESLDLFGEGLADAGDFAQSPFFDYGSQVFLHGLESPGSRKISPDLEGVLPFDFHHYFHHRSDALQNFDYVFLIHFQQLEELPKRNRRKSESMDFPNPHLPELDPTGMTPVLRRSEGQWCRPGRDRGAVRDRGTRRSVPR